MPLRFVIEILAVSAALPSAPLQDCRTIADPQARLACYDARDRGPTEPAGAATPPMIPASPVTSAPPPAARAAPPVPPITTASTSSASPADIVRANPTGRIAAITPLRYGLFRIQLDDGRQFNTTSNTDAPPAVGDSVSLRRTLMGTTFLDIQGRSPITVRLQR